MTNGDQVDRMLRYIVLGIPKEEVPIEWTSEKSAMWDRLSAEVAEIHAKGMQVELTLD
ncbi:MAG: hypothetical protein ACKVHY_04335 [Candidatus Nanopelagicales bacterium]